MIKELIGNYLPHLIVFCAAMVLTLILTPLVREMNRRLGMVDKPDPRRINKIPIPRGGGLALFAGVMVSFTLYALNWGDAEIRGLVTSALYWRALTVATAVVAIGYIDDKWSLPPKLKLLGQLVCAFATWWWCDLGFSGLWPSIPKWLDCVATVFWVTGAINAFNLIDGLDGLASGIAHIAALGMAGTLMIIAAPNTALFHIAFAGGLLGFLRYNYNPASVFLGDCGSMFIGYMLAVLPLTSITPNSFLVSVGVPMLAMGVPIFDTALAIIRRSIRHIIRNRSEKTSGSDKVMIADADHLHHRILRSSGLSQRRAAWILYAITAAAVGIGLVAMTLESRAAGLWLVAVAFGSVVIFKNMARIELYDAGRLLSSVVHDRKRSIRRRIKRVAMPLYLVADLVCLFAAMIFIVKVGLISGNGHHIRAVMMVRVVAVFIALFMFDAYRTVWSRAMLSNFFRLFLACAFGSILGGAVVVLFMSGPAISARVTIQVTVMFGLSAFMLTSLMRLVRPIVRDLFYMLDCTQSRFRKDVSRVLVYGAGLRYRTFRRELVRSAAANNRIIVGIIDDNILIRHQFIGGIRIEGTLHEAPEIINRLNVDAVVIACVVRPDRLKVITDVLKPTGVKISHFTFSETPICDDAKSPEAEPPEAKRAAERNELKRKSK